MAVVNPMHTPMFNPNVKDSRWLTLEVCREFQRTKCSRTENECKFAHPPPHVEVQNGRVTCCFDSIKGKCQRKEPPCKYLHPPQHLREQLLQNGRNNLILKNLQMQYIAAGLQPTMIPGVFPPQAEQNQGQNSASPEYRASPNPTYYAYEQVPPYIVSQNAAAFGGQYSIQTVGGMPTMMSAVDGGGAAGSIATSTTQVPGGYTATGAKITRPDRLEPSSGSPNGGESSGDLTVTSSGLWTGGSASAAAASVVNGNEHNGGGTLSSSSPQYSHVYLQNSMGGMAGMVPMMKRPALDNKSGIPMYQPNASAYQQAALAAMQLQQQPFAVPVSISDYYSRMGPWEKAGFSAALRQPTVYGSYSPYLENVAGHPPSVPRF